MEIWNLLKELEARGWQRRAGLLVTGQPARGRPAPNGQIGILRAFNLATAVRRGAGHRMAFWSAARRWAEAAVASGFLSVDDIRNGATTACTLLLEAGSPAPIPP